MPEGTVVFGLSVVPTVVTIERQFHQPSYLRTAEKNENIYSPMPVVVVGAAVVDDRSSPHTMTHNVTSWGASLSVVLIILIIISRTFSVGNCPVGRAVGAPRIAGNLFPDSTMKTTSISTTFFECIFTSRTIAPRFGKSISIDGDLLLKSTPLLIKSWIFDESSGRIVINFDATSMSITSVSVHDAVVVLVRGARVVVAADAVLLTVTDPLLLGVVR